MTFTTNWLKRNETNVQQAQLNFFVRMDEHGKKSPIYILYKTIQPLYCNPHVTLEQEVDLPLGRVYNVVNLGVRVAYLFELPKKPLDLNKNYFSVSYNEEDIYKDVRVCFITKEFSVMSPKSNNSMLVILNTKDLIDIMHV
jgi:hypothetical protein